mgnify:CR=1 FL=1
MGSSPGSKSGDSGGKAEKAFVDKQIKNLQSQQTDQDKALDALFEKDNAFQKATGTTFADRQKQGFAATYQRSEREKEQRQAEKKLANLTEEASLPGQKGKYYYDKVFEMEEAIKANPNLTNFQKVTEIDKLRTQIGLGSGRFEANKNFGLNERVAAAGTSALRESTKNTPLTQEDFKNLSFDQKQRAAMLMSKYKAPVVLTRDGQIQSTGGFKDVFTDIAGGLGSFGEKVLSGDVGITGAFKNAFSRDDTPEPMTNYFDTDYADYFAPPRLLDEETNFSPTGGDYLGIAGTPEGMELQNIFLAQNQNRGTDNNLVSSSLGVAEPVAPPVEEPQFLAGYDSNTPTPIIYPSGIGGNLVSYEDIINQVT